MSKTTCKKGDTFNVDSKVPCSGGYICVPCGDKKHFSPTDKHTTCFWKGQASYYTVDVDGTANEDGAWYYPNPTHSATLKVKKDFTNYIAFWHGVQVTE
jgi:uncharacterized protein (DUF427 family)